MSKSTISKFTKSKHITAGSLTLVILSLCFSTFFTGCSNKPALPGNIQAPEVFQVYLDAANKALEDSQKEVKKAEAAVAESRALLEEAKTVHASMRTLKAQQEGTLKKVRSERAAIERRKAEEAKRKQEEEQRLKEIAEATPTPPPYAPSDAPVQK